MWTTRILTTYVLRIASLCPALIRLLMHRPGMACCHSLAITRSPCTRLTQRKHLSSPPHGLFCYNVMPFGLKNAGATYQRLVTKMFRPLLGKTMEVYIDDMLIKSKERQDHANHLQQVFNLLRTYGMKLNLATCAFGVNSGRFLGFMMTQRGIEANPSQLKAILESPAPSSRKEVQQLTGRLAALGRFISWFTDRLKPFFATLRGANRVGWNEECDRAFTQIK